MFQLQRIRIFAGSLPELNIFRRMDNSSGGYAYSSAISHACCNSQGLTDYKIKPSAEISGLEFRLWTVHESLVEVVSKLVISTVQMALSKIQGNEDTEWKFAKTELILTYFNAHD